MSRHALMQQQVATQSAPFDDGDDAFGDDPTTRGGQTRGGANGNGGVATNSKIPRYAAPTSSTSLPEYSGTESEAIRASFSTGSYKLIAHLPTELRAHHVSEATAARIDDNITSAHFVAPHGSYRKLGGKGANDGLFSTFDYKPEDYSLASKLLSSSRKSKEAAGVIVNPLPFLYSTPRPMLTNGLVGATPYDESLKYSDPYACAEDHSRREIFMRHQGLLHGPFVPTPGSRSLGEDRVLRSTLPTILKGLMRDLDADWGDVEFQIYADPEDLIIMQFTEASLDNVKGLQAYMAMFVKTNKVVSENILTKLVELWSHSGGDGFLYFALRPPWVRRRPDESFYALHPEMQTPGVTFEATQLKKQQLLEQQQQQQQQQKQTKTIQQEQKQNPLQLTQGSSRGGQQQQQSSSTFSTQPSGAAGSLSTEERERMASLMASFDAGLQGPRKPAGSPAARTQY